MNYSISDIIFWSEVNIDHLEFLLADINDNHLGIKTKLEEHKEAFIKLINNPDDEYYIYRNIKIHSAYINDINDIKINDNYIYQNNLYTIKHMIKEGFSFYSILLVLEQDKTPIPILENIKIHESLLPSTLDHLHMIKEIDNVDPAKVNYFYRKYLALERLQNKIYLHYSQFGRLNPIKRLNIKLIKASVQLLNFYENLKHDNKIITHIIKEEKYYLDLLYRFKKSFRK